MKLTGIELESELGNTPQFIKLNWPELARLDFLHLNRRALGFHCRYHLSRSPLEFGTDCKHHSNPANAQWRNRSSLKTSIFFIKNYAYARTDDDDYDDDDDDDVDDDVDDHDDDGDNKVFLVIVRATHIGSFSSSRKVAAKQEQATVRG